MPERDPAPTEREERAAAVRAALARSMAEIGKIPQDGWNPHHKYHYASTDAVLGAVRPVLGRNGITVRCDELEMRHEKVGEQLWAFGRYQVAIDGLEPEIRHMSMQVKGPQAYGAMSAYVLRYWLRSKLLLDTGDSKNPETEADAQKGEPPPRKELPSWSGGKGPSEGGKQLASRAQRERLEDYMRSGLGSGKTNEWLQGMLEDADLPASAAGKYIRMLEGKFGKLATREQRGMLRELQDARPQAGGMSLHEAAEAPQLDFEAAGKLLQAVRRAAERSAGEDAPEELRKLREKQSPEKLAETPADDGIEL